VVERLTERDEDGYIHIIYKCSLVDCYNKLGKLEDIEEELGIPLEVLFKALKDGIYVQGEDEDGHLYITKLENYKIGLNWCKVSKSWGLSAFATKDYGKTWWLDKPKEKLENERKD